MYIQSDLYLAITNIIFKQQYTFTFYKYTAKEQQAQVTKYFEVHATKYDKLSLRVPFPVQSVAIFKLYSLIYFHLKCKILVKIPDSVLDSALALRGKEGDIVREKP